MTSGKEQRNDRRDTQPKRCIHAFPFLGVIDIHRSANDVHYINVIIYATPRADDHLLIAAPSGDRDHAGIAMLGEALVVEEIPVMGQEDAPLAPCACEHVLVAIAEQSELAAEGGVPPLTAQIFSDLGACAPPLYDYDDYHVHLRRANLMNANLWTVAEAKAKLSRVIEEAQKRGPQTITRRGRRAI